MICCVGLAQLGERLNGIQEVEGSIPFSSTIFTGLPRSRSCNRVALQRTLPLAVCLSGAF